MLTVSPMLSVGHKSIWTARISMHLIRHLTESGNTIKWIPNALASGIHFPSITLAMISVERSRSRHLLTLALYYRNVISIGLSVLLFGFSDAVELAVDLQQLFVCKVNVTHILHSREAHKSKPAPPQIWVEQVFMSLIHATI